MSVRATVATIAGYVHGREYRVVLVIIFLSEGITHQILIRCDRPLFSCQGAFDSQVEVSVVMCCEVWIEISRLEKSGSRHFARQRRRIIENPSTAGMRAAPMLHAVDLGMRSCGSVSASGLRLPESNTKCTVTRL